jgi:glycosyltransferase involved in cell wall biosynthesis
MRTHDSTPRIPTVLFFDHTAKLGGAEIALFHLLQQLDKEKFNPVAVLGEPGALASKLRESGIETHIIPLDATVNQARKDSLGARSLLKFGAVWKTFKYCLRLARFIKSRRIDLIHTNSLKADIIGGICSRLTGVPVVWHVHDRIDADYLPKTVARLFRLLCRVMPDFVVANSIATLKSISLPVIYPSAVVYEGVLARDAEQKNNHVGGIVGLVGRLTRWKGQHVFLEAAAQVRQQFPNTKFQVIGSAMFGEESYEQEIRALSRSLGLEDCVEFTGFRNDVPRLVDQLDILVHASTTGEPFGQVITEGMLAAKPVIATRGGGVPEIVQHGSTGLLVPMGDADAMAAAICALLSNPDLARAMGKAGRERALQHFVVEKTVPRLEAIFQRVLLGNADAGASRGAIEQETLSH